MSRSEITKRSHASGERKRLGPRVSVAARFWKKVDRSDSEGCWIWKSAKDGQYGRFWLEGQQMGAHRASWILAFGEDPGDLHVCHHCDNPRCVRPDHLFLGTVSDNLADAGRKGRLHGGIRQTHCRRGHHYETYAVYYDKGTKRYCGACAKLRRARHRSSTALQKYERATARKEEG